MAAGAAKNGQRQSDCSSGASASFVVLEEDDISGASLDSDLFWGRAREEQTLDYHIQRWSLDSRVSTKAPPIPVTDLQEVTEEMMSKKRLSGRVRKDDSETRENKGRVAKVIPAYRTALGTQKPFRVLSNVKIVAPNSRDNNELNHQENNLGYESKYFQGTEQLIEYAMESGSSALNEVDETNNHNRKTGTKKQQSSNVYPNSSYYPSLATPKITGLSFSTNARNSLKSGATQTHRLSEGSLKNSPDQKIQDYEGHVISEPNLLRKSTLRSSTEAGLSFSDSSLPEDDTARAGTAAKFLHRQKCFKFPQETFGLKISENGN